jgi:lipoate-protein ligase A
MNEKTFRVIDTGVMEGKLNIAIGQAIVEMHQEGKVPDTLRFLRFPPTALVGRHQALGQEIDLEYCAENDIGVVRRITGGGAIFMEPGLLGWELAFDRHTLGVSSLPELTREICEAAAGGISRLGVKANYRPRNDIEIDGRKVSGTGGFFDGDTLFFQGTVLVDMSPAVMVKALKVPQAKLAKRELDSAEQRVVTLRELMGDDTPGLDVIQEALVGAFSDRFGLAIERTELSDGEMKLARERFDEEIGTGEFLHQVDEPAVADAGRTGRRVCPGGTITTYLQLEGVAQNRIGAALVTGDFFVTPPRIIYDLESRLRRVYIDDAADVVREFFASTEIEVLSVSPEDFIASVRDALSVE